MINVLHGDCCEIMPTLEAESFDAIVCDPPYHLTSIVKRFGGKNAAPAQYGTDGAFARASKGFMSKVWDGGDVAFRVETWEAAFRVLKPGGHLLAFSGTRTYHRMVCAIEDAGFEIRDQLAWIYGSGFPKSHNVSKAIDKMAGAIREVVGSKLGVPGYSLAENGRTNRVYGDLHDPIGECEITAPATPEAVQWAGWGTALKPAHEPIVLARKPLSERTVAANVLKYGCGALNIDATRIPGAKPDTTRGSGGKNGRYGPLGALVRIEDDGRGRFPANLVHDGSPEVLEAFAAFGESKDGVAGKRSGTGRITSDGLGAYDTEWGGFGGSGSPARFFFSAKANADDRMGTAHPTTKPTALIAWLLKLVTPPGGHVLDPFAGSGTLGVAAKRLGFSATLIESDEEYVGFIKKRMAAVTEEAPLLELLETPKDGSLSDSELPLLDFPKSA